MADDPLRPQDSGKIGLPPVDSAMNKVAPLPSRGGKGSKDDEKNIRLGAKDERKEKIMQRARSRLDLCIAAEGDNRAAGLSDDKFWNGDQWPADIKAKRNFDRRPCLTVNRLKTITHQITNDQRMNRPAINISPVGDRGDPEAAKMYAGMIREIERKSEADIAYDTAFESTVRKGWGYWRIMAEYERPNSFDQVLTIKRVNNAFTIYKDPNSTEPDASDAQYFFITEMIPRDEYKEKYPKADPMSWTQGGRGDRLTNWMNQKMVRIAEYYEIEHEKRKLVMLSNGATGWRDEMDPLALETFDVIAERESDEPKVMWYKLNGVEILEETHWLGKWIPVIGVVGDEINIDGKMCYSGIVRDAQDPQRMINYWITSNTERVALAPKAKWLIAEGQDEGYEQQWQNAHTSSDPRLIYNPQTLVDGKPVPPPIYIQPEQVNANLISALQQAQQDMAATTGVRFDATVKDHVYDESGRALRELRRFGDIGSFHYVDNLARSLRFTGEQLIDLIPKYYERKRVITILREDSTEEMVQLDPSAPQAVSQQQRGQNQKPISIFNPKVGEYGVTVTIGPSYATKRIESAESMMDFVRALPMAAPAIMDLVAKEQDWPGAREMATRLARVVAQQVPGALVPEQKDMTPQVQALLFSMQEQIKQLTQQGAVMQRALFDQQADRAMKQDKIDKDFEVKVLQIMQKADQAQTGHDGHIGSQLKDIVQAEKMLHEMHNPPPEKSPRGNA